MTDKKRHAPQSGSIPEFHSREEEAAFWDSHDLADYWDTFKPVRAWFNEQLTEGLEPEEPNQRCVDDICGAPPTPGAKPPG